MLKSSLHTICAISSLFVVGCAAVPLNDYDVYIAEGFSSSQHSGIISVLHDWEQAEKEWSLHFKITTGTSSNPKGSYTVYPLTVAEIADRFGTDAVGSTHWDNYLDDSGELYLPTDLDTITTYDKRVFTLVTAHEVGHLLGLSHTGPDTIMSPDVKYQAHRITCTDQWQYANIRGEDIDFCDQEVPILPLK